MMELQIVRDLFVGESNIVATAKLELAQEINNSVRPLHKWVTLYIQPRPKFMPRWIWKKMINRVLIAKADAFERVKVNR